MVQIYPNFIMPLFNTFTPLEEGELRSAIEALARQLEYPLKALYEMDGSRRSSHSNAFLFGFGANRRIVLFDTLLRNDKEPQLACTRDEVVAIIGHELGHWQLSHTIKGFLVQNVIYLAGLYCAGFFLQDQDMYRSFGFTEAPVLIGLSLFGHVVSPLGALLGLCLNSLTRKFEFEADAFAVDLGKASALKAGLVKISISNLASFDLDPVSRSVPVAVEGWGERVEARLAQLSSGSAAPRRSSHLILFFLVLCWVRKIYSMFHHSHPSLVERLQAMDERLAVSPAPSRSKKYN
jgi:STE24 endopeptidase